MGQEVTLKELEEIIGVFRGISTTPLFTEIEVGSHSIALENKTPSTTRIAAQLERIEKGTEIGILKFNGTFRLRRCEK